MRSIGPDANMTLRAGLDALAAKSRPLRFGVLPGPAGLEQVLSGEDSDNLARFRIDDRHAGNARLDDKVGDDAAGGFGICDHSGGVRKCLAQRRRFIERPDFPPQRVRSRRQPDKTTVGIDNRITSMRCLVGEKSER